MDGVVTVIRSGGQYQVVIGNHVPDVYKEACAQLGLGADTPAAPAEETAHKGAGAVVLDPIMAVLCAPAMISGIFGVTEPAILANVFISLALGMAFTFVSCYMLYKEDKK